jgi:hypothetical protein
MLTNDHLAIASLFERARFKTALDSTAQSHLDSCDTCRLRLSWMEAAAELGPRELAYEPPKSVMDNVLALGRNSSRLKQVSNAIVALLTFDSFKELAPAGVRHSKPMSRQMTYEHGDLEIGLWLRSSEDRTMTVSGQVLDKLSGPIQDSSGRVDLVFEGEHIKTTFLSSWGEFVFTGLPKNHYSLQVFVLDRVLQIPSLSVVDEEGS